ncbi:MAG TPA: hypothetical protein VF469_33870 [Kofleriaceae bacterium]
MKDLAPAPPLLHLFHQLRRRNFLLGPDDLLALHSLLGEGYGWTSRSALRDLCRVLWAKSYSEQLVLDAIFDQCFQADWDLATAAAEPGASAATGTGPSAERDGAREHAGRPVAAQPLQPELVTQPGRLPPVPFPETRLSAAPFVLVPQYPVSFRTAAQAWRRLRRPVRFGPAIELDLLATITRRASTGVATPPVLRPRRRNTAMVTLLIDRHGSMAPFADFAAEVARSIQQSAQLASATCFYFHDVPAEGTNDAALARLPRDTLFPAMDGVLSELLPARHGWFHRDPELLQPVPLTTVLRECTGHAVIVVSDAGAARRRYDAVRVLDSLALAKALRAAGASSVWLNPLPEARWTATSAAELARHVAMFSLDRNGMHRAVNHLRGQPAAIEQAV